MGIDFRRYAGCFFVFVFLFFSSNSLYPYDRGIRTDFSDGHDTFLGLSFSSFIHVNKLQFGPTDTTRQHVLDRAVRSISFTSAELCFGFGCMYLERFSFFLSLTLHTSTFAPFAYMYVLAFLDFLFFSSMVFLQVPRVPRGWIDLIIHSHFLKLFREIIWFLNVNGNMLLMNEWIARTLTL